MRECKFCPNGKILFQNELFVVYRAKAPECLKNHFVVESTRQVANEDDLTGREKFWLELTIKSAKNYFVQYLRLEVGDWQLAVDFCSPHFHIHVFEPAVYWQPSKDEKSMVNLAHKRVREIQRQFAGLEAEL